MAAYLIRRIWQMVPTLFGVVLLVFLLFKGFGGDPAEILAGLNATPGAGRRDPPAARPERAALDPVRHLPQADRHLRLGPQLGDQRVGREPVRDAAAGDADGDGADPRPRHAAGDPVRARRRLRARLAHRPGDHGRDDGGALDLVPGLRARRPVRVRVPARPVPGAGLERQRGDQPAPVRAAAGAARGGRLAGADDAAVPHLLPRRDRPRLRAHGARQGADREASSCSSTCCATR